MAEKSKNENIGMDESQAQTDRAGYKTTVEYVTGGMAADAFAGGGVEVGNQYDEDQLGEEYSNVSYGAGEGMPKGSVGKAGKAPGGNRP